MRIGLVVIGALVGCAGAPASVVAAPSCSIMAILAIERQDVEGIRLDFVIVLARVQDTEIGNTVNPKDNGFAIDQLICSTPRTQREEFCKHLRSDRI